jgi:hypothetical protein
MRLMLALAVACLLVGCRFPADPDGTLERVRHGTLRAGLLDIRAETDLPRMQAFAASLDARLEVRRGDAHTLATALSQGSLDLLARLPKDTPFAAELGLSRELPEGGEHPEVWAVPAGENAWLVAVNRFLASPPAASR